MKRRSRAGESWLKRITASLFYRLINRISDSPIPVDTGDFRLMSRRTVEALNRLPERNRYLKGMFAWVGMPTVTLEFDRDPPRIAGSTKWNYLKLVHLAMEASPHSRPDHCDWPLCWAYWPRGGQAAPLASGR